MPDARYPDIPDDWTASVMLRNMAVDWLTDEAGDSPLDAETRSRMTLLAIVAHLELANTVGALLKEIASGSLEG